MGIAYRLLHGPLMPLAGHAESAIVHANPLLRAEQPAQHLEDLGQQMQVALPANVGSRVRTIVRRKVENVTPPYMEVTDQVTAFIDKVVHIPWLEQNQPMTGHVDVHYTNTGGNVEIGWNGNGGH